MDKQFKGKVFNSHMSNKQIIDYEGKFSRIGFKIQDLFHRYNNMSTIKEINAAEQIPTFRTIIKDNLHKEIHQIKDWLDKRYFSKDVPLGTYIHQKFNELEDKLGNGDDAEQKYTTLKNILSELYESLPEINYRLI